MIPYGNTCGHYWLVQYCHDPSRAECINVGVILLCYHGHAAPTIMTKMSAGNERIRRLVPITDHADVVLIEESKTAIVQRLATITTPTVENLNLFAASRANAIRIQPAQFVHVLEPTATLDALFLRLVEGPPRPHNAVAVFKDQVMQLHEGPALDRIIAERVMGWIASEQDNEGRPIYCVTQPVYEHVWLRDFQPSQDIADAWRVVHKLGLLRGRTLEEHPNDGGWWVDDNQTHRIQVMAPTAPLAICRAAILVSLWDREDWAEILPSQPKDYIAALDAIHAAGGKAWDTSELLGTFTKGTHAPLPPLKEEP